ncbi:MAG: lipoyl(octanoyl) transferase LipB [Candidatus Scalinduaceae bacterium]
MNKCLLLKLDTVEYGKAWELQKRLFNARYSNQIEDVFITLQHPPTYTLGRRNKKTNHFLTDEDRLRNMGYSIYRIDRGGATTYHGPGQIVCYPIIGMKSYTEDYYVYLRMLEEVMIKTLQDYKIKSRRVEGYTGVWIGREKIGFVGVRIVGGTTMHGFSLNVNNDLTPFNMIVPCGIQDVMITSISKLLKINVDTKETTASITRNFADVFGVETYAISLEEILEEIGANETPQLAQG